MYYLCWGTTTLVVHLAHAATLRHLKARVHELTYLDTCEVTLTNTLAPEVPRKPSPSNDTPVRSLSLTHGGALYLDCTYRGSVPTRPPQGRKYFRLTLVNSSASNSTNREFVTRPFNIAAWLYTVDRPKYRLMLENTIESASVKMLSPPRPNTKLLVLDIDETLLARTSWNGDRVRPGLHSFLAAVYRRYDIAIFSHRSMASIERTLDKELCMTCDTHGMYTVSFIVEKDAIMNIQTRPSESLLDKHQTQDNLWREQFVKPLEVIWRRFPGRWNASNTIHIDDIMRSFAFNPHNGLCIKRYRAVKRGHRPDRELLRLASYLLRIAETEIDFSRCSHSDWHNYC